MLATNRVGKNVLLALVIFTLALAAPMRANSAIPTDLRANLVVSDARILVYGGMDRGIKTGQRFAVIRNNQRIATIEITEVRTSSSIARVITKLQPLKDNDLLAPLGDAPITGGFEKSGMQMAPIAAVEPDSKKKIEDAPPAPAPKPEAAAAAKTDSKPSSSAKTDDSKSSSSRSSSSKSSSRSGSSSSGRSSSRSSSASADTASSDSSSDSEASSGKSSSRSSSRSSSKSSDTKKEEAPKAAPAPKKKEKPADPRYYAFPTAEGFSGLWTVPTSDIIPKREAAFSYYHGWYESESRYNKLSNSQYATLGSFLDMETDSYSLTYGLDTNIELAVSRNKMDMEMGYLAQTNTENINTRASTGGDGWSVGLKYNPRKHFMLEPTTHKSWSVAFGAQRIEFEDVKGHNVYMMVSLPMEKFDVHGGIFHYNMQGIKGDKLGSMAGVEFPLSSSLLLIGEMRRYQADYTYNAALRYVHREKYSLLMGLADATDTRVRELGLSMTY